MPRDLLFLPESGNSDEQMNREIMPGAVVSRLLLFADSLLALKTIFQNQATIQCLAELVGVGIGRRVFWASSWATYSGKILTPRPARQGLNLRAFSSSDYYPLIVEMINREPSFDGSLRKITDHFAVS